MTIQTQPNLQTPRSSIKLAFSYMLTATLLLACMHGLIRDVSQTLHPIVVVFFRNLFGLIVVCPLLFRAGLGSLRTQMPWIHVLRAFVGLVAMSCWFYSLSKIPIANATALSFSTTIFAALSAWMFLGERMRFRRWAAILVGFIGVLVVLRPDADGFNKYSLMVLVSALAWGVSVSIVKHLSRQETVVTIVGWMAISLTALSLWPALLVWQTPDHIQLLKLLLVGALATGGHLLMTSALKLADTSIVMSVDFSRLIWTAIIGAVFFAEVLDRWTFIGACIIFGAGLYIIFRESQQKRE